MPFSTAVVPFSQDLLYPSRFSAFCQPSRVLHPLVPMCFTHTHTRSPVLSLVTLLGLKGLPLTVFLEQYHTARSQMFTNSIESFMHSLQESRLGWRWQCTRQMGAMFSQSWRAGEILNNPAAIPLGTVKGQSRVLRKGL